MSNPNEAINDFLIDENTNSQSHPDTNTNTNNSSNGNNTSRSGSNNHNNEDFDYEMQDLRQNNNNSANTYSSRPTTSYIPQYTINTFPIQEVVPNSQMAMATGMDMNNDARGLRGRTNTVSANVLNVSDFYSDNNNQFHSNDPNDNINNDNNSNHANQDNNYDENTENNVPMMVKPKTLYQNPQTPTVLPSTYHPINKWSSIKQSIFKEFLAEFMGTMIMILFGCAVCCQVEIGGRAQENAFNEALQALNNTADAENIAVIQTLQNLVSSTGAGTFDNIPLGWGAAVLMGYFGAGGSAISGAHLNPAVTVSNFIFRGFPAKKVMWYISGQLLGGFAGGLICLILYKKVIEENYSDWKSNITVSGFFVTVPKTYLSTSRQVTSEFITTATFQAGLFALTDPYTSLASEVFPIMLFILIFILNAAMSYQTGCAINMARDFGPRLGLYAAGFDRAVLWESNHHYFWVPMCVPYIGAVTGGLIYDICVYQGHESPVNWPLSLYKEMITNWWFRRPGWKRRNRGRSTSDLSDFSFQNDDDNASDIIKNTEDGDEPIQGILKSKKSRTKTTDPNVTDDAENAHKSVSFKSVQRGKRMFGGVPTILEENDSIETASLGAKSSNDSDMYSETSSLPQFTSHIEKRPE
ncbi:hypothetical protein KAFR_0I01500 [Kazachstania africana CBS 2517]|uniref:Aquaporin n=1 Tax=Kazachstania africana (strain ATCC 22294 / BCRC 22015 / CBS 2517 / CECT 1963 / NBRC 1671 / NRRL Y-8276) TaxID=1071382 RepID=H2AZY1_KAZAF|nr:hypothetical protein KAFR_0I01500 [Kazachstania africana CBS 2517]CCF59931.1 hypothetical protein KAFR_0I01500 [Kazachstania africana CBS 2517]